MVFIFDLGERSPLTPRFFSFLPKHWMHCHQSNKCIQSMPISNSSALQIINYPIIKATIHEASQIIQKSAW